MRIKYIIILVVLFGGLGVAVWNFRGGDDAPTYRMERITRGDIAETIIANGILNPVQLVNVGTQVSGKVNKVYVSANDHVEAGKLLAEIDPSLIQTQLKRSRSASETAKSNFEAAKRNLDRMRTLIAKQYVAQVELEQAEQNYLTERNNYESSQIQVEQDQVSLGYTKITSPINGIVISAEITEGQTVQASFQTPNMFKIAGDLKQMKIDANLAESDISQIKMGQKVRFTVDAYPDREFKADISAINLNPNNQQGVVTYIVTIGVSNEDLALLPGMTANLNITLSEVKNVLRIPASALRFQPPKERTNELRQLLGSKETGKASKKRVQVGNNLTRNIYVWKKGELNEVYVTIGATDETYIEIISDVIAEGDMVVTGILPPGKH